MANTKVEIRTNVVNGNLKRNRNLILETLNQFEGKDIILTIQKAGKRRSNNQNAYYWGIVLKYLQLGIKESWAEVWELEKCHEFCKIQFNVEERYDENTGEVLLIPKSTTENTTTAQEEYHDKIRKFIFEWFNIQVPLPNEEITIDFNN